MSIIHGSKEPTKLQMAKVITKALFMMDHEPSDNHWKVKELKAWRKDNLQQPFMQACYIITNFMGKKEGAPE